jgi:hypothetical protein
MSSYLPDLARTVTGVSALRTATKNEHARFSYDENNPKSAGWRIAQRAPVDVAFKPKFSLSSEDAIFTMGSCFARNVEARLIQLGLRVLLSDFDFPVELFGEQYTRTEMWQGTDRHGNLVRSILNKYSPLSMLNEFQRVLQRELFQDPYKGLIQLYAGQWYDPQLKNVRLLSLYDAFAVREIVEMATQKVTGATAIFLTLGYTETWLDSETNLILNVAPRPLMIKRWPERFRFFNAGFQDVLDSLEGIRDLITRSVRPDMKFIITVSPVPLGTTFTEMDVITANAQSKATLRTAAAEFCARHDNVDYFPSYEMVTSTHPEVAWEADKVHVAQPVVDMIMDRFVDGYFAKNSVPMSISAAG